ncbi:MAG: glycosyltransferase family 4 protein [Deltaproteobacteria bacterium]|nr:glycosyltransferase family 4 protein [Candidatus Anaeroferrophillus wilburensis]MBN2889631.1 glycosyltransferase family 4 protein [Deltaproteobacteria bacterium]
MNIWFINHYSLTPQEAGGTRHYSLASRLIEKDHQVTIIAASYNHWTRQNNHCAPGSIDQASVIDGIQFIWLRTPPYTANPARVFNMLTFAWHLRFAGLLDTYGKPDVIIGSSPHLFAAYAAERLAAANHIPFVLEIRDLWPLSLMRLGNFSSRHPFIFILGKLELYLYRRARLIISLLPEADAHFVNHGAPADRIVLLPNGTDLSFFPPPEKPVDKTFFSIYYAGTLGLANGVQSMVDAAAILQQRGWGEKIRFFFLGEGPDKKALIRRCREENLQLVTFLDPVAKHDVQKQLCQADAFILTLKKSDLYRFGMSLNKLYDYLAMGRPIIFGGQTPHNPVAETGAGFVVPAEDAQAMANAIVKLASLSGDERWAMGQLGRKYIEKNHDISHLGDLLEKRLLDVLS